MKFGVLQFFSWPDRRVALPTVYERALERIEIMDRTGYDAVWLTEHHFSGYSVCPSVLVLGSHAAARTERLRIGTGVTLANLYHPLRLAEETALLDVLSGGRLNWGAGRGFDPREFRAYGVPEAETHARFRESVDVVLRAWTEEKLNYRGEFFSFDDVEVLPKPLQQPHPPTWMAATSPPAIEWAASNGHSILMDPHSTHAELGEKRELYRRTLESSGHSIAGREIPMARLLAVAPTDAEAAEVAARGASWMLETYVPSWLFEADDPVARYVDQVAVHGSPERVVAELERLNGEIGLDYMICAPLSHESFLLFTEKVMPRLSS
jgi:alkanesulfonate monooxygenase SsuD/methylene tetrahydromethanopterin reductase-like flavin-dependent oxidoreductase (luciferase family)